MKKINIQKKISVNFKIWNEDEGIKISGQNEFDSSTQYNRLNMGMVITFDELYPADLLMSLEKQLIWIEIYKRFIKKIGITSRPLSDIHLSS